MKVKVTRSIDISDVPTLASEMLDPACDNLDHMRGWLSNLVRDLCKNKITATMSLLEIRRLRSALIDVETVLADVESIMSGLAEYEKKQELAEDQEKIHQEALAEALKQKSLAKSKQQEVKDEPDDLPF